MNILILSFYYSPDLCAGSFRTTALVKALQNKISKKDKLIVITTMPNRYKSYNADDAAAFEQVDNLEIHRIKTPSHKSGLIDQVKSFGVFFKKSMRLSKSLDIDLVFATSSRLFTAYLGAKVSKKLQIPLILDIRDIFVDTMHSVSKPIYFALYPILKTIENTTFNRAKHINLVSEGFSSYFLKKFPKTNYSYFTNGIDPEFLEFNFNKAVEKNNKLNIVYAGNIGQGQGLHKIIPSLAKSISKNYSIQIIGDGGAKALLEKEIEKLQLKNVKIFPPVKRNELLEKYKDASILLLHLNDVPAFEKVLPSKVFEYAATGKPILAGVSGYSKEFISNNIDNAFVFSPCDANDAVTKLAQLELNSILRENFINSFSRRSIMDKFANLILNFSTN